MIENRKRNIDKEDRKINLKKEKKKKKKNQNEIG